MYFMWKGGFGRGPQLLPSYRHELLYLDESNGFENSLKSSFEALIKRPFY